MIADVSDAALEATRARAARSFAENDARGTALDASGAPRVSWVDGSTYDPRAVDARKASFDRDGFIVSRAFADRATVAAMKAHMAALTEAFRGFTPAVGGCALGSVKSNFGHAHAAAGVAGLL